MPEEIKAAQETDLNASETDSYADIGQENDGVNDNDFADTDGAVTTDTDNDKEGQKQNNSENARRRRSYREKELEKARKTAREQAIIETLGGKNPYNNEEMKDSADVEEYLLMKEIEKQGGDPLSDYSKHLKAKERKKAEARTKAENTKEWYRKDGENFAAKYPEVNIQDLISDEQFNRYADGKVGEIPLSEIYEGYTSMVKELKAEAEKSANQKAQQQLANAKASPGALSSTNPSDNSFFTREQVRRMSQEEVHKNYDKIRASMSRWK